MIYRPTRLLFQLSLYTIFVLFIRPLIDGTHYALVLSVCLSIHLSVNFGGFRPFNGERLIPQ